MKKYLIGGGKVFKRDGGYTDYSQIKKSPVFCREVEITQKCTGNAIHKTWVTDLGEPKLVRDKVLKDTLLDAYLGLKYIIESGADLSEIGDLLDYIEEYHTEYLI